MVPNPAGSGTLPGRRRSTAGSAETSFVSSGILLVDCPDRRGIVASIAQFLYEHGANILHSDQHQDNETERFFMRIEWALEGFDLAEKSFVEQFAHIAESFQMQWRLEFSSRRPRIAILVSRDQHCLV